MSAPVEEHEVEDLEVDVLVVGAGVAGSSVALGLAGVRRVLLLEAGEGSTPWAQGGIAATVADDDRAADHAHDTDVAGAGLCDPDVVATVVAGGPAAIASLLRRGARWDRATDGRLALGLEGGHHRRRIVHAGGDTTGREVHRVLEAALATGAAALATGASGAAPLLRRSGRLRHLTCGLGAGGPQVSGAVVDTARGVLRVSARAVVLATGGLGHAYARTTNPDGVDGSGLAAALRVGATLTDLEFVQFHPTALRGGATPGRVALASEALRGEGAVLRDHRGRLLMAGRHPLADLAPRDVVAREIARAAAEAGSDHVWLDARPLGAGVDRFPTFLAGCHALGLEPAVDLVPVSPAEHYLCGGIRVDSWGRSDVAGLLAVGEVAATGLHGANRLASNSLLEGLVLGARLADRLALDLPAPAVRDIEEPGPASPAPAGTSVAAAGSGADVPRRVLDAHAGVLRDAEGLARAADALAAHRGRHTPGTGPDGTWLVASAVVAAATLRTESRGAHHRVDHPSTDPAWVRRTEVRLDADGLPRATVGTAAVAA